MEIKSNGIDIHLDLEEAIALCVLLDHMSIISMNKFGLDDEQASLVLKIYGTLSAFVPER